MLRCLSFSCQRHSQVLVQRRFSDTHRAAGRLKQTQWHMKKKQGTLIYSYDELLWFFMNFFEIKTNIVKKIFFIFAQNFWNLEINFLKIFFYFCFLHRIKRYSDSNLQAFTNTKPPLFKIILCIMNSCLFFN